MKTMHIGTMILHLRKQRNMTQEELARKLHISAGAISKWETGTTLPDITILSPLAHALHTSIDILMGYELELSNEAISKIKQELMAIRMQEGLEAAEAKCDAYVKEYGNSIPLKLCIASHLLMFSMGDEEEALLGGKKEKIVALLEEVIDSKDVNYVPSALFLYAQAKLDLGYYVDCEAALKKLNANTSMNPYPIYQSLFLKQEKFADLKKISQQILLTSLTMVTSSLYGLSRVSMHDEQDEQTLRYLMAAQSIYQIFQNGMDASGPGLIRFYCERKEHVKAALQYKRYIEGLLVFPYDYEQHPFFDEVKLEVRPGMQKMMRKKLFESLLQEREWDILKGQKEYDEAMDLLAKEVEKEEDKEEDCIL